MDNISHSVAGLAAGELLDRCLAPEPDPARASTRRRMLLVTGWAACNFPDLDLLLTRLLPAPLGYLMHHRGHTHTLLYAIPQVLLLMAAIWLLWPAARTLLRTSAQARTGLAAAATAGMLLHLAMDYLNVYGVHLWYPFYPGWQYGDMVFIVEPAFWVIFGAPLAAMVRNTAVRVTLFGLLIAAPVLALLAGFLQWGSLLALALLGLALVALQRRRGGRTAISAAFATALALVAVQGLAARAALHLVLAASPHPGQVLDVPLSAFPSNPACWSFVTVEKDEAADSYRVRRGVASVAPWLSSAASCPAQLAGGRAAATNVRLAWLWSEAGSLSALRRLERDNCHMAAWLRFARAPWVGASAATDVRYGAAGAANFSTLEFARLAAVACAGPVPGWGRPRGDLLRPALGQAQR